MTTYKAYQLPNDPDPADFQCFRVYLPNDPAFHRAFWGSMTHLAKWVAWDRDLAGTAAVAANSMKKANDLTMAAYLTEPCICLIEPPYTENTPDGRTPTEATIDDVIYGFWDISTKIKDILNGGGSCTDVQNQVYPYAKIKYGLISAGSISSICDAMAAKTPAERTDAVDPDNWLALRDEIICTVEPVDTTSQGTFYDWLNNAATDIFNALDTASDWLFNALDTLAGEQDAGSFSNQINTDLGGGAGFGWTTAVCLWTHTIDFTTGQHGWGAWASRPTSYSAGNGWQEACWMNANGVFIFHNWGMPTTLTKVQVNFNATLGTINPPLPSTGGANNQINILNQVNGELVNNVYQVHGGSPTADLWTGSQSGVWGVNVQTMCSGAGTCDGDLLVFSVLLEGTGVNPYAT